MFYYKVKEFPSAVLTCIHSKIGTSPSLSEGAPIWAHTLSHTLSVLFKRTLTPRTGQPWLQDQQNPLQENPRDSEPPKLGTTPMGESHKTQMATAVFQEQKSYPSSWPQAAQESPVATPINPSFTDPW